MARICIVNFHIYILIDPKSQALMGGAELDLFNMARQLKADYDVSIITADWGQKAVENYQGIPIYRSARLGGHNYPLNVFLLWQSLKQADADIYISAGAGPEVAIIALFCRFHHKKYIYRQVSSIDVNGEYIRSNLLSGQFYKWGLEQADRIATCVAEHGNQLKTHHPKINPKKIVYIPLSIDQNKVSIESKKNILWVSRCVPMKNPEIFLDLARFFPTEKFVMIAPCQTQEQAYFERIKKQASSLSNLEFHDFVPFGDIQPYFNQAKVFINTSDFEGFTFTLLQSGAAGTPVVYYKVDPDGVIEKNNLGGFAKGDRVKLQNQLTKLVDDAAYWQKCSRAISQYANKNHSSQVVAKKWLTLIQSLD